MVSKPKTPAVTQEDLLSNLKVQYEELIELNKIRNTVVLKESEQAERELYEQLREKYESKD